MEGFTLDNVAGQLFHCNSRKEGKMGRDIGRFVLLIAGNQGSFCLITSIYSKKKETGSSARRSEVYQEEKICNRCCKAQKKETRIIGLFPIISIEKADVSLLEFVLRV